MSLMWRSLNFKAGAGCEKINKIYTRVKAYENTSTRKKEERFKINKVDKKNV